GIHCGFVARLREIPQEDFAINSEAEDFPCRGRKWINNPDVAQGPSRMKSQAVCDASEPFEKVSAHRRFRRIGLSADQARAATVEDRPVFPSRSSRRAGLDRQARSCLAGSIH